MRIVDRLVKKGWWQPVASDARQDGVHQCLGMRQYFTYGNRNYRSYRRIGGMGPLFTVAGRGVQKRLGLVVGCFTKRIIYAGEFACGSDFGISGLRDRKMEPTGFSTTVSQPAGSAGNARPTLLAGFHR